MVEAMPGMSPAQPRSYRVASSLSVPEHGSVPLGMFDLAAFSLSDMLTCSAGLRDAAADASTMEQVGTAIVRYLYDHLLDKRSGERSLALVRFYKTQPYEQIEPGLQDFVRAAVGEPRSLGGVNCLTLLATAGDEPAWNDRHASRSHKAIPLVSTQALRGSPMVLQLVRQLGLDPQDLIEPDPALFRDMDEASYNVFYVPEARGSEYVPAQNEFVLPHGIRSVLGFGGVLPTGSLFAVVMFSKIVVPAETADAFGSVALAVKLSVLPFAEGPIFDSEHPLELDRDAAEARELRLLRSEAAALNQLLAVRQNSVLAQSLRLEQAVQAAEERATDLAASREALSQSEAQKAAVVRSALDAIIAMDARGRIVEFNPAAVETFGYEEDAAIGQPLVDLLIPPGLRERHIEGLAHYLETGEGPVLNHRIEIRGMRADGTEFPIELTVTPVAGSHPPLFTGFVRDITQRHQAEADLVESRERFAHIARTLQESLLPPSLPEIPGVELAAVYLPAGLGNDVGGDFYDVFEIGRNDWAFTLGDVCGKGAQAAALTALARYTVRAAAIRARRPSAVLAVLNQAIHRQHPDQFCTIAVARMRVQPRGIRLSVASGGHPPPLLVHPNGHISELADAGLLVGPFPDWHGSDRHTLIHPGDTFVLYSDGVTEARADQEQFGEDRLKDTLAAHAGRTPPAVAGALRDAVLDFASSPSDDIAILVARIAG
ncbi:MAG: phosphoserine phosphatase RsbU/P [Acidimicrobiaceae bacterium]|nr:phosphoserine phosphatase RsbU/P [Acidimicrobiaceae bacterium]